MNGRYGSRAVAAWVAASLIIALASCADRSSPPGPAGSASATSAPAASAPASLPAATASLPAASASASASADAASANPAMVVAGTAYRPEIDPAEFSVEITNPYMPLVPGTVWTYEGDGERVETTVTERTRDVMGIPTVVVRDRAYEGRTLIEDTEDWFAQDAVGNVWYFGEDTAECSDGAIASRHGAWEAGVDGAQPGVVMLAQPAIGEFYRQEFFKGQAEDVARVLELDAIVKHASTTYRDVVVTEDFTALEPKFLEHKMYAPTVGLVEERLVKGGSGVVRLVDVQTNTDPGASTAGKLCRE